MKTETLNQIVENCKSQLLIGTLLKNVKRGLLNDGLPEVIANKILRIAELETNDFQNNKAI